VVDQEEPVVYIFSYRCKSKSSFETENQPMEQETGDRSEPSDHRSSPWPQDGNVEPR